MHLKKPLYLITGKEIPKGGYTFKRDFRMWEIFSGLDGYAEIRVLPSFILLMFIMATLLISGII